VKPYTVGLTGGIGSGKSAVAALFAELGIAVVDTDEIAHELTRAGGTAIEAIRRQLGDDYIDAAGAMDRAAHALLAFAPDGLELGPAGDDVDGTERTEIEPEGGGAAVGDEIPFQKPGAGIVPFGKGADGDLVLQPGAGAGDAAPAERPGRPDRGEQPLEGRGAHLPEGRAGLRRHAQRRAGEQAVQELGDEGLQPDRPDLAAGLPEHLGGDDDVGPVHAGPAGPGRAGSRARRPMQTAEGGLAVIPGDRDHFIEDPALLPA